MSSSQRLSRRRFLQDSLAATACTATLGVAAGSAVTASEASSAEIVDTHVYLGRWPFRHVGSETAAELGGVLRVAGISTAWASTFEGLLHKDISSANLRLADSCRGAGGMFVPFGTVNPMLPDWEEDVRRCHEVFRMPGIRLHPNFHSYALSDACFARLLELAAARNLIVQLVAWLDDEKRPYLKPVPPVDLAPLAEKAAAVPDVRLMVLNGCVTTDEGWLRDVVPRKNVSLNFAKVRDANSVKQLVNMLSSDRVMLGSSAPLLSVDAAAAKLTQSGLTDKEADAISVGNARCLIASH